jgi:hypothetical protein
MSAPEIQTIRSAFWVLPSRKAWFHPSNGAAGLMKESGVESASLDALKHQTILSGHAISQHGEVALPDGRDSRDAVHTAKRQLVE